ncbi:glycosyltransferase [Sphaerisporangium album]|uniref:Glycosyltransferase n=1 Tax=Sphaerisporangium album TaxID=509200 RepID=A0A367FQ38_9ACTN|nr:glycosyltransferase family 4 protein [Sphaerisporangium album]RCG31952.1 glycosyltransferase [Sphaerisporangium album]
MHRIVLTWLSTARGGAEKSVVELADHLARFGLGVDVIWWRQGGPPCPAPGDGVRVLEACDIHTYRRHLATALGDGAGAVLISTQRTVTVDLLHRGAAPVLSVVHGIIQPDHPLRATDPASGELVEYPPDAWMSADLRAVDCWVGISSASAASIRGVLPAARVETIFNGVTVPERLPQRPPRGSVLRVAAVARAVPWKRLEDIIRAAAHPSLTGGVHLDLYGQVDASTLEALACEQGLSATFHGWVEDLPHRLAGADILVGAALVEGFGRCAIDAAGVGTPAILPRAGAGPEVVLDGLTGILYDPHTPGALVAALRRAVQADPAELDAMGRAARARARAWFSPQRCAVQYLDLAHELLARHRHLTGAAA